MKDGFLKVAAAAPEIRVADPAYNTDKIIDCIGEAKAAGVKLLTFPELVLTGATCGHLYFQRQLTDAAMDGLRRITVSTQGSDMLVVVGLPLAVRGAVYSAARRHLQRRDSGLHRPPQRARHAVHRRQH